jgi:hypothetical protein
MALLSVIIAALAAQAQAIPAARTSREMAVHSLKAVFAGPTPSANAGAVLNYLSFEDRPGAGKADPVAVELRAQAAEFLARRMPVEAEARHAWSQQLMILNRLRDYLDEDEAARVQEGVANMARSRRHEIASMIENAARDWRWTALGILDEAAVVAAPAAPESNVVVLKPSRPTAPERKLFEAADIRQFPKPEVAAMLGYAQRIRRELGWGRMAAHPHEHDALGQELSEGEHAVVLEMHGNPAMIASLSLSGLLIGFGSALTDAEVAVLRKAGVPLGRNQTHPARFQAYYDEAPLKDSAWFQRWRKAHLGP